MKVKTLKPFIDLKEGKNREVGDVFTVTQARLEELDGVLPGYVEKVEEKRTARKAPAKEADAQ